MLTPSTGILLFLFSVVAVASPTRDHGQTSPNGHLSQPSLYQSPRFRWWWPGGWPETEEVRAEIGAIVDAGFGGGEIGDVEDSISVDLDPKIYGWGRKRWNDAVLAAYQEADALGGHVDLTLGPHWPTGFPGYTPDSPETSKELVHGQAFVEARQTFSGKLPLPVVAPSGNETGNPNVQATPFLAAVLVAKTSTTNSSASIVEFDPSTVEVITSQVKNNTITWQAPGDGTYVLVAAYCRGTGQIQNIYDGNPDAPRVTYPFPAYIVDHFSPAGVQAGVKYWDEHILTPELRPLLRSTEGSIFEDSLELKLYQYWTLDFLHEFRERRGYDLSPYLLYVIKDSNTFSGDDEQSRRITNDFYQTVSDLYIDYRLGGLKRWANSLGMKLRIQPYTISADSCYAASAVDIPEGESLGFDGDNDAFRVLATGRDVGGKTTILSDELGAYFGQAYGVTWKFILGTSNLDMALGVSQVFIHGFPYRDSPSSVWPGFAPFTPLFGGSNGFADAWGPRQPQWMFAPNASRYLANAQKLLQDGGPSIDVAILNQDWGVTTAWDDISLNEAGFSYQFPTPGLLRQYDSQVRDKRLVPDGPAYKALLVNQTYMDVSTADRVLSYGKAGLPIVLYGSTPNSTFSFSTHEAKDLKAVIRSITELEDLPNIQIVSGTAAVPTALESLGVRPSVVYPAGAGNDLITYRRTYSDGFVYWIYNAGNATAKNTVQLEGTGNPYYIDLWQGTVDPIVAFSQADGYVALDVKLKPTAAAVIFIGANNPFGALVLEKHITSTNCESYASGTKIHLLTDSNCTATLSDGKTVTANAGQLPAQVKPTHWTLTVQDWSPAHPNATGIGSSATVKEDLPAVNLSSLVAWPEIPGLEHASGVGHYETTVRLEKETSTRTYLDVGEVEGSYGVRLNGISLSGVDQFGSRPLDVTDYIKDGVNRLEIIVATTLWNKLIEVWPAVYGSEDPQEIGLTGPVVFSYMHDVEV